ncbi:MAG: NfeD family protein [candidate division Zixibacteria bacterium]|nr:NfeD family protein [candidate division Zixibacteria bacterium]
MPTMFWIWMAAALVFLIIELSMPTLIFLCFVVGSLVAGTYAWFNPTEYYWQVGICLAVSIVLLPFSRRFAHRITKAQPQNANVDRFIGHTAIVTKAIDPDHVGQVTYQGEVWQATADEPLAEGSKVIIASVTGTRVRVERVK